MADIFISYSRRDSEQALSLKAKLEAEGFSVWLDVHGIEGAEQWATEIVEGINSCSTFLLLLSPSSIQSENVLKELSLSSEKGKRILPVDIGFVTLPSSFEYQLAGIQRVSITDIEGILRAHRRGVERKQARDLRKSLIILPFSDHSPEKDNEWFADGLAGEIINSLASIKSLRVLDRTTSLELRNTHQTSREIAQLYDTRYIVEGSVTKFGQKIKVSAALIDMQTQDHLWQDSYKGVMDDIFELQETVTEHIVTGLKVSLTAGEKIKINERGTESAEAYELYMKGLDYFKRASRETLETSIELHKEAIQIDPRFALPYCELASCYTVLYRRYKRDENLLEQAEKYINLAEEHGAEIANIYRMKGLVAMRRRDYEQALRLAKLSVAADPNFAPGYNLLGVAYAELNQLINAADAFSRYVKLRDSDVNGRISYLIIVDLMGDKNALREAALEALPFYERHTRLYPDDLESRINLAIVLNWAGDLQRSVDVAEKLVVEEKIGAPGIFNLAHIFELNADIDRTMDILELSIDKGFRDVESFDYYRDHHKDNPRLQQIMLRLEELIATEKNG